MCRTATEDYLFSCISGLNSIFIHLPTRYACRLPDDKHDYIPPNPAPRSEGNVAWILSKREYPHLYSADWFELGNARHSQSEAQIVSDPVIQARTFCGVRRFSLGVVAQDGAVSTNNLYRRGFSGCLVFELWTEDRYSLFDSVCSLFWWPGRGIEHAILV